MRKYFAFLFIFLVSSEVAQGINLVNYVIAIPENASKAEIYCSNFLQRSVLKTYKIKIAIRSDKNVSHPYVISIGNTRFASNNNFLLKNKNKLGLEGLLITSDPHQIILYGKSPRGQFFAITSFMERELNLLNLEDDKLIIKRNPEDKIVWQRIENPAFEHRSVLYENFFNPDFYSYHKGNMLHYRGMYNDSIGGGSIISQPCHLGHTFGCIIPSGKYYKENPKLFSQFKGQDVNNYYGQLCLSNDTVYQMVRKYIIDNQTKNPDNKYFNFSANDGNGTCECARCSKVNNIEKSKTGTLIRFLNRLVKDFDSVYPDLRWVTLSYLDLQYGTVKTKVNDKINIIVSTDTSSWLHTYSPINSQKQFITRLDSWKKCANNIWIWDYTTNFNDFFLIHPVINVIAENLKFCKNYGIKGVMLESHFETGNVEENALRSYVFSKLLWNPDLDYKDLIEEFVTNYYPKSGNLICEYYKLIYNIKQSFIAVTNEEYIQNLNKATLDKITKIVDSVAKLELSSDEQQKVDVWLIAVQYSLVKYRNYDLSSNQYIRYSNNLSNIINNRKHLSITNTNKHLPDFIALHRKRAGALNRNSNIARGKKPLGVNIVDASQFTLVNDDANKVTPTIIDDAETISGLSVKLPNKSGNWLVYIRPNKTQAKRYSNTKVQLRVKVDKLRNEGYAFNFIVFNNVTRKFDMQESVETKKLGSGYTTLEFFPGKIDNDVFISVVAIPSDNVSNIYIDNITFVDIK